MSDFRAIAGVSSTLRALIADRMDAPVPITIAPPDVSVNGVSGRRLNLYLYQITENGSLKNQEIPGQGQPGGGYGHPPLSLDLHYLFTAHGSNERAADADIEAQQILGDAMRVLHDFPTITPDLHEDDDPLRPFLLDASLQSAFERVKITLHPATLEDFSKIWTAMPEANFRRSVMYRVSVVQIESKQRRRVAPPVRTRQIHMTVGPRPQINQVSRTPVAPATLTGDIRVAVGQQITIEGANFVTGAVRTWVRLGDLEPIGVTPVSDTAITFAVPDDQYPVDADHAAPRPIPAALRLQPGPQRVEVLTRRATEAVRGGLLDHGETVALENVQRSNQAVFLLTPQITTVSPASGPAASTVLVVQGRRLYRDDLPTFVLVGDAALTVRRPVPPEAFNAPTATRIEVPLAPLASSIPPVPAGTYPVRVQTNGALNQEDDKTFSAT